MSAKDDKHFTRLEKLVNLVKGRKDVKARLAVLTNPENLDTMTILSKEEAHFLAVGNWLTSVPKWGAMFEPMQAFAQANREPNISIGGRGRMDSIEFVRAINEAKAYAKLEGSVRSGKVE